MADEYTDPAEEINELIEENQLLKSIILNTFWMARRYANGRQSVAPSTVNECLTQIATCDMLIAPDHTLVEDGNSNPDILDDI